ncbi:Aste57867_10478 [Aphanomyces stellatus]|uniref:Aste57867_10478 protein n=1 Tax=Aphanomyces stellatus TaxID=120398 RepID=A0A485KR46_9STRA|nr:hypothetical protein As57867_010438 [Aphanomyces stellatus]VFT87352.1 Aste57867_10478 [Aphanomyces stellatus]
MKMPISNDDDDAVCKYVYKVCTNKRTLKKDGSLHRLCEFHRSKANALQKVYATKRRRERRAQRKQLMEAKKGTASTTSRLLMDPIPVPMPLDTTSSEDSMFIVSDTGLAVFFDDEMDLDLIYAGTDVDVLSDEEYAYLSEVF